MNSTRKIDKKVKKKKIGLIFIILGLLIAVFFILFTKTNFFGVARIDVKGNITIEKDKAIMASGLVFGENIFKINLDMVENNLLVHPYIRSAKVKRKIPNKIIIEIAERKEIAVANFIGSYIYFDNEGIILNVLSKKKNDSLIEIKGLDIENVKLGETLIINGGMDILTILNFIDSCKEAGLVDNIKELNLEDHNSINLVLKTGTRVALGDLNNVKYKLRFTLQILEKLKDESYDEEFISNGLIDFTKGDNPIFIRDAN